MPSHIRHPELDSGAVEVVAVLLQIPNQVRDDDCMAVLRWGGVFLQQKNPPPELVEGSMYAKRCRPFDRLGDRVVVHERILQRGARPIRHPELDSGAVEAEPVSFTDPESSSG